VFFIKSQTNRNRFRFANLISDYILCKSTSQRNCAIPVHLTYGWFTNPSATWVLYFYKHRPINHPYCFKLNTFSRCFLNEGDFHAVFIWHTFMSITKKAQSLLFSGATVNLMLWFICILSSKTIVLKGCKQKRLTNKQHQLLRGKY